MRIEWGDCDPAGIIFYPRYFEIFDASTAALFERALGITKFEMFKTLEFAGFPLVRTHARFLKPTRFGDDVTVESHNHLRPLELRGRAPVQPQRRDSAPSARRSGSGWCAMPARRLKSHPVPETVLAKFGVESSLLDLRRDLLQDLDESLAIARADDAVEIALVPARAARQHASASFCRPAVKFRR